MKNLRNVQSINHIHKAEWVNPVSIPSPTLHMLCGKIASGKSTLAARLAQTDGAVIISEDEWLYTLFSDHMSSPKDYVRCSAKLRKAMKNHISQLLENGISVVLDFQANTVEARNWLRTIIDDSGVYHQLHVLHVPDEKCLERLHERNASGEHQFAVSDEQYHQISRHFSPPSPDENFNLVEYDENG